MKCALFALISGSVLLAGCGGGGGGSSSPETATGVFIDEAVEGLTFISGDQMGKTDAVADIVIDFSLSVNEFSADRDVQVAITSLTTFTTAGARMLIPSMTTQEHLAGTLIQQFSGNYSGTFMGVDGDGASGGVIGEATVFEITINDDGSFTGTFENDVEDFDGTVQGNRD